MVFFWQGTTSDTSENTKLNKILFDPSMPQETVE